MPTNNQSRNKTLGAVALLFGLTLALFLAYHFSASVDGVALEESLAAEVSQPSEPTGLERAEGGEPMKAPDAPVPMADQRESDALGAEANAPAPADLRLQKAELDHLGDVFLNSVYPSFQNGFQLDRDGRAAIDVFVASMPDNLGDQDLDAISAIIKAQLPAAEAEELAFIITQLYRLEQEEARLMSEEPVATMADQLEAQQKLSRLREERFGPELAALLFSQSDDTAEPLVSNDSGAAGKAQALPEAQEQKQAELAGIEDEWEARYQKFLSDKQVISEAGLDQSEKDRQIEALLRQHYPPQEVEAARAYYQAKSEQR